MAEFSNVLRLIASVSNYENSSCSLGMSEKALEEYFHNVFKDEKTYEEFYKRGCYEMSDELFEYIKIYTDVAEFSKDAEDYIYGIINPLANPYISVHDNFQSVVTEMLHDACGYVGRNLNDSEFEDFHEYMDTYVSVGRYIEIMVGKKLGRPFDENNDIINDYAISKGISYTIFYPKKETANVDNTNVDNTDVEVVNRKAKDVCAINIERTYEELTYAILNTSNYDGGIGATIVKCYTPIALEDYGFDNAECADISMLKVGELYTSTNYGSGVVVVRMS